MSNKSSTAEPTPHLTVVDGNDLAALKDPRLQAPIEDFVSLLSQSRRAFVIGAGCSKCAGLPLMSELTADVLHRIPSGDASHEILQGLVKQFEGSGGSNIEDYMSELVDLISITERRESRSATQVTTTISSKEYSKEGLDKALTAIKKNIEKAIVAKEIKIQHHRELVKAIHGRLQSGKSGQSYPVDYFTLNYDTLLEDALSLERISAADGFNGGVTGWWSPEAYDEQGVRARVFKVHGSIDWCLIDENDVFPSRIRHTLKDEKHREPVLIWPAATKYRETQRDPYAQIIGRLRNALRPQPSSEVVLGILGYSFGDSHINFELDRALHQSDGRVSYVVFTSDDGPTGIVKEWVDDHSVNEHVRVHANKGFFHADSKITSEDSLPWWKFEVIVRLLGGEK